MAADKVTEQDLNKYEIKHKEQLIQTQTHTHTHSGKMRKWSLKFNSVKSMYSRPNFKLIHIRFLSRLCDRLSIGYEIWNPHCERNRFSLKPFFV